MDDERLHRLRNELNTISIGVLMLKQRLHDDSLQNVQGILPRIEEALEQCVELVGGCSGAPCAEDSAS